MEIKKLIELRKEAEKAVSEMPDGDIKVKAFEVILNHLLTGNQPSGLPQKESTRPKEEKSKSIPKKTVTGTTGRILVLKEESFFNKPKSLGEIKEELAAHGWHYASANLSPILIKMVQQKHLRRNMYPKKGWGYINP